MKEIPWASKEEAIADVFERSRRVLSWFYEDELSLAEQINLKRYCVDAVNNCYDNDNSSEWPVDLAIIKFKSEEYDTRMSVVEARLERIMMTDPERYQHFRGEFADNPVRALARIKRYRSIHP
jgi:hypothetical protein